ncbi:MAG: tetratricopeptide repeat protein [Planctomycetes bacterium]|nr:tetratricopeptide repeat protein [Planctomycetota bacterium]MCL4729020.1 tetratricopeptide repeat protein [Planctomycetota bacterium]
MHAETAYLFRHALLRDAAYEMQLPTDRARLHELAFFLIEQAFGGRAPEPPSLDAIDPPKLEPHPTDPVAAELAEHARLALQAQISSQQTSGASSPQPETGVTPALHRLYLRRAAEHAEAHYQPASSADLWSRLAAELSQAAQVEATRRAGMAWFWCGNATLAEPCLHKAVQAAHALGNRRIEVQALSDLAVHYRNTGRPSDAMSLHEQALALARAEGNQRAECFNLGNLAINLFDAGNMQRAEELHREVITRSRQLGLRRTEAIALAGLASVQEVTGSIDQAYQNLQLALAIARETGDRRIESTTLANLANVEIGRGRLSDANRLIQQALEIQRATGDVRSQAVTVANLAVLCQRQGDAIRAERYHVLARALAIEVNDQSCLAFVLANLAALYRATERLALAEQTFEEALRIHARTGERRLEASCMCEAALCHLALGRIERAAAMWHAGVKVLAQIPAPEDLRLHRASMREACARAGVPPFDEGAP